MGGPEMTKTRCKSFHGLSQRVVVIGILGEGPTDWLLQSAHCPGQMLEVTPSAAWLSLLSAGEAIPPSSL